MTDKTAPQKTPAEVYGDTYLGPIFYFCLRKTGDLHAAEDLASDITLQVLTALHKGINPRRFSAWVWQIARNRYAFWAKSRRRETAYLSPVDPDDPAAEGLLSEAEGFLVDSVDHAYARSEEMMALRRELAFLKREWREVVVAYYIEDRSVSAIAASTGLSEGTVKSRLFRARDLLKEGMNMAREFGPKSYKPETVRFAASGSQPYGWPWNGVERSLPKNILLEASGNPSTVEELAVAVGVAMPYMEEEIAILTEGELLKPVGKRYVTNFYIESRDVQTEIDRLVRETAEAEVERFIALCRDTIPIWRTVCTVPAGMSDHDLLWLILPRTVDELAFHCTGYTLKPSMEHKRPQETWGFIGFEGDVLPGNWCIGHNGYGMDPCELWTYVYFRPDRPINRNGLPIDWDAPLFLRDLLLSKRPIAELSDTEHRTWHTLCDDTRIAHIGEDGCAVVNVPVVPYGGFGRIYEAMLDHPNGPALQSAMQVLFDRIVSTLARESHEVLQVQLPYCASMHLLDMRAVLTDALLSRNVLSLPEEATACMPGTYLLLRGI